MPDSLYSADKSTTVRTNGYTLYYKLTRDNAVTPASYSFFVSVENEEESYYDEVLVRDVTSSEDTANNIFRLITEGAVTPTALKDVLEDVL